MLKGQFTRAQKRSHLLLVVSSHENSQSDEDMSETYVTTQEYMGEGNYVCGFKL